MGDTFHGSLGGSDFSDGIRIDVVAGQTYTISMTGVTLPDPLLYLYDQYGNYVTYDDDGGLGLNSELTFQADYTGEYLIAALEYSGASGTYEIEVTDVALPETWTVDEIASYLTDGLSAAGQQFATWVLASWTYATGIEFQFSSSPGADIMFGDDGQPDPGDTLWAYAYSTTDANGNIVQSFVDISESWIAGDLDSFGDPIINTYSMQTYIHEIGHALGWAMGAPITAAPAMPPTGRGTTPI